MALYAAAEAGRWEDVERAVNDGADVNEAGPAGNTALMIATSKGNLPIMRLLLEHGAAAVIPSRPTNSWGSLTAMEIAARNNRVDAARLLIEYDADVRQGPNADNADPSPLSTAAFYGNVEFLDFVLTQDPDTVHTAIGGKTALWTAVNRGFADAVSLLIKRGAIVDYENEKGRTPLLDAAAKGDERMVNLLLGAIAKERGNPVVWPDTTQAEARLLIEKNAPVDFMIQDGQTQLMLATRKNQVDVMRSLLDRGANVNLRAEDMNNTALRMAAEHDHMEAARLLLDAGAKVDYGYSVFGGPLIAAAAGGHVEMLKLLLDHGAISTMQDFPGNKALHHAASNGHLAAVRVLLEGARSADVDVTNKENWTPLIAAAKRGNIEIVRLLIEKNADVNRKRSDDMTALHLATERGHTEMVDLLLSHGADADAKNWERLTPLMMAATRGHEEIVKLLLESNANVELTEGAERTAMALEFLQLRRSDGMRALHFAVKEGHYEVASMLLSHGADVDAKNKKGRTPLMLAAFEGHEEISQLLLANCANLDLRDDYGYAACVTLKHDAKMTHRFLGNSGLLVSKLALGSWMRYDEKYTVDAWYKMMATAFQHGVNFFDNAEVYGNGQAERLMGGAIKKGVSDGVWSREDLVITTKICNGSKGHMVCGPNDQGLSRKHIVEGMKASLARLQLNYVDVVFCHRPEPYTPIEETVRAMNYVIEQGWAFYWGTSEWLASDITEACEVADRLGLIRPIVEQPQYNLFARNKVDYEFVDLYKKYKLGLTTWSPLAFGTLTGKYSSGKPDGSRFSAAQFASGPPAERVEMADKLKPIAKELGCSLAQMSIAWAVSNENVSTVLMGASRPSQLEENLKALEFVVKITPEVKTKIDAIVNFVPTVSTEDTSALFRALHL